MPPTTHLRGPPDDPETPWIVQKYGGTSVGKFLDTIANIIAPGYLQTHKVAIVCSARSGQTKALGTTNLLLQAASEALAPSDAGTPGGSLSNSLASLPPRAGSAFSRAPSAGPATPVRSESTGQLPINGRLASLTVVEGDDARSERSDSPPPAVGYNATVDRILTDHLAAARSVVQKDSPALAQLEREIFEDCERLRDFLMAAKIIEEISPRSKDIIIGAGERLSCRIVVGALRNAGVNAELVTLENIVEQAMVDGAPAGAGADKGEGSLDQAFYDNIAAKLGERLNSCKGVPVVTGYFGNVPGSLLSQIGRGYTDLCAALCAVGVCAQELQIWKEVDGVFTADPRKVPTARLIPSITPEEAAELTYYGSEVIHPFTMEQAIKKAVPIRIKNVENPSGSGTVIFPDVPAGHDGAEDSLVDGHVEQPLPPQTPTGSGANTPWGAGPGALDAFTPTPSAAAAAAAADAKARKLPTAVTIKDNVLVLNVHSNRKTLSHGFFARIFGTLDRHGVVVDLISTSEVHVSMAIGASLRPRALERITTELSHVGTVSVLRDMAILSLVGKQMRQMVGVAGKMFSTLAEGNVNIEMISQGASEINISCVIHEKMAMKALNLIHYSVLEVSPKPSNLESGSFGRSFF